MAETLVAAHDSSRLYVVFLPLYFTELWQKLKTSNVAPTSTVQGIKNIVLSSTVQGIKNRVLSTKCLAAELKEGESRLCHPSIAGADGGAPQVALLGSIKAS